MYQITNTFNVPAILLKPTKVKINGIYQKTFIEADSIFISAKSYGGTEKVVDDIIVVEDTMSIETYYRPDIASDCKIRILDDNSEWEIISPPEDIDRKHFYLKFKVRRVAGGA